MFLAMVIVLANAGYAPVFLGLVRYLPGADFTGHLVLFGTMSFLLNGALRFRTFSLWGWPVLWGTTVLLMVSTAEECSQYFIPSRTFDWKDLSANVVGIVCFGELGRWWWGRKSKT